MSEWIKGSHALPPTALAGIDLNSGYMPVRRVFFYDGQPDTDRLKASLASALGQWPDFAGTIAHNSDALCLLRKDTGVRFTIEQCDDVMPPFGIDHPLGLPCPWVDEDIGKEAGDGEPVFTVKVTAYRDKRWILGTCNSHALCDGSGYWQFMQSWRDAFHNKPAINNQTAISSAMVQILRIHLSLQYPIIYKSLPSHYSNNKWPMHNITAAHKCCCHKLRLIEIKKAA
jgi:hypothetical protein